MARPVRHVLAHRPVITERGCTVPSWDELALDDERLRRENEAMTLAPHERDISPSETLRQIGRGNVLAISGGRVDVLKDGSLSLPVAHGYSVRVSLSASDTYNVERLFTRSGVVSVKGAQTDVYCDEVGEVAYRASCYHHAF